MEKIENKSKWYIALVIGIILTFGSMYFFNEIFCKPNDFICAAPLGMFFSVVGIWLLILGFKHLLKRK